MTLVAVSARAVASDVSVRTPTRHHGRREKIASAHCYCGLALGPPEYPPATMISPRQPRRQFRACPKAAADAAQSASKCNYFEWVADDFYTPAADSAREPDPAHDTPGPLSGAAAAAAMALKSPETPSSRRRAAKPAALAATTPKRQISDGLTRPLSTSSVASSLHSALFTPETTPRAIRETCRSSIRRQSSRALFRATGAGVAVERDALKSPTRRRRPVPETIVEALAQIVAKDATVASAARTKRPTETFDQDELLAAPLTTPFTSPQPPAAPRKRPRPGPVTPGDAADVSHRSPQPTAAGKPLTCPGAPRKPRPPASSPSSSPVMLRKSLLRVGRCGGVRLFDAGALDQPVELASGSDSDSDSDLEVGDGMPGFWQSRGDLSPKEPSTPKRDAPGNCSDKTPVSQRLDDSAARARRLQSLRSFQRQRTVLLV